MAQDYFYQEEYIVTANSLNMRDKPGKDGNKVALLTAGNLLQFVEIWNKGEYAQADSTDESSPYGQWMKVKYKDKTGWVFSTYVAGSTGLYYEDEFRFDDSPLPPVMWYGVYARDSFADELRKIQVRVVTETNEFYGGDMKVLKTDQKDKSKFIIGSASPLLTGYCGQMGTFDINTIMYSASLNPGAQLSIYPGNDLNDTTFKANYGLAATGCATLKDNYVTVSDYRLTLIDFSVDPVGYQDLTPWVKAELSPAVDLVWFGDIDNDSKPDAIIQDCPYEMGCRASLFLSSKAKKGSYLHKICEHFWPGD